MSETETLQLNCPKCEGAVRVRASAVGRRVRCPRCQADFKVPGVAAAAPDDDDDWLNLDQTLPAPAAPKNPAPSSGSAPSKSSNSDVDDFGFAVAPLPASPSGGDSSAGDPSGGDLFSGDLPPAPAAPAAGDFNNQDWAALQSFLGPAADNGSADNSDVADVLSDEDVVSEFRVTCLICGSITYARPDQVGKQIKCHDCYSPITVPPPPKPKKVYKPDIDNAEVFGMFDHGEPPPQYDGPIVKSAAEYLREAEEADEEERDDYENPDVRNWAVGVFKIFLDPQVAVHWLLLSILGSMLGGASVLLSAVGLIIPLMLITLLYWGFTFSCGFSIMESVSTNAKRVEGWPYMAPTEWFGELFVVAAAAGLCMGPPAILGGMIFGLHPITVMMTMFSLFLLFPFVLISILDSESIFVPFSAEVTKSVTRCQEQWGVLYLTSGILFFGMFMFYIVCFMLPPLLAVVLVYATTVAALFVYFSMIGRLAYAIGHAVNAPPASQSVQRERRGSY